MIKQDAFLSFLNKKHFNKIASFASDYLDDNTNVIEDKLKDNQLYSSHEIKNKYLEKVFVLI